MRYRTYSHLGVHYEGNCLKLAHMYADSVIEVESCFGYVTWPAYQENIREFKYIIREQVNSEETLKFISVIQKEWKNE